MFTGLRDFIAAVEGIGDVRRIRGAEPHLEIGAITEVAAGSPACPLLLFEHIRGHDPGVRIVTNLLHTTRRLALALGLPPDLSGIPFVRTWKDSIRFDRLIPPVEVDGAPFREHVREGVEVDLHAFPSPTWHPGDGGPYFGTGTITIARDPDDGYVNYGIYRLQTHDRTTLGVMSAPSSHLSLIREKYWARGESCPVVVCNGVAPLVWLAGLYQSVPFGISEYDVAGSLLGQPVEVVKGELTGLPIPASAEFVLEGEIPPPEVDSRLEGPFGEYVGYYASGAVVEPVIRVKRVLHRTDPILHGSPPMKPLPGLYYFGINWKAALIWKDLERGGLTGIAGVWQHGVSVTVVAVRQHYPGQAKQIGHAAAASRINNTARFVIVVDDDIDPANLAEVLWAVSTRCEPEEIDIVRNIYTAAFDPRIPPEKRTRGDLTGSRAVIDACRPFAWRDAFPAVNEITADQRAEVWRKWGHLLR